MLKPTNKILNKNSNTMLKPIKRFVDNDKTPLYKIHIEEKRDGRFEWFVDKHLIAKGTNKEELLEELEEYCREQLLKIKQD